MSLSAASCLLPDAESSWRFHKSLLVGSHETVSTPAELKEASRPVVVGLPATACRTIGIILPTTENALLEAMIEAQLEKRGIIVSKLPSPNYAWHMLGHGTDVTMVSVDVLASPFPPELAMPHAANYTAALRLVQLPPAELVIVEEQSLLVLAAGYQGRLWHSHVLGAADMSVTDLARELELAKLSLEAHEGFGAVRGVTLVGERLTGHVAKLKAILSCPVEAVRDLERNRTLKLDSLPKLLPLAVYSAQASKSIRRKIISVAVLMVAVYAVLFALGWLYLQNLDQKQAALLRDIAQTSSPASEVRTTAQRWRSLAPAIEVSRYPMMQLTQITGIMPPSGVLLKKFEAKPDEIMLTGDSRDAQTATQFLEDLKKQPQLGRFTWSMPVPSVRDKVASFKIQGKLEGGS